jgi:hypothetical protein
MEQTKTNNRGGVRQNAGRKKSANPKSPLSIYLENQLIEKLGGKDEAKKKLKQFAETCVIITMFVIALLADNWI